MLEFSIVKLFSGRAAFGGILLFALSALIQCSHQEVNPEDPEALYSDAEEAFKDERYLIAIEKYRDVKNRFPYSSRSADAELRIADTYFAQESFLEAVSAYEIFKELHPTHPKRQYVQYMIGLSYFNEIPGNSARDLSAAHRAIEAFGTLIEAYPNSEYISKSKELLVESRKKLAEHENSVADFYFQRKHYLSASYRYASLIRDYSNLGYDEEALYRLAQCYYHIRMFANAREILQKILSQFPQGNYAKEVVPLLEELGKKN